MNKNTKYIASILILAALLSVSQIVRAGSTSFGINPGDDPCPATFTASVPDGLSPGQGVTISGSVSVPSTGSNGPCQLGGASETYSFSGGSGSINWTSMGATSWSGDDSFLAPSTPGTYTMNVSGSYSSNYGGPVFAGGALTFTVASSNATLSVTPCSQGGTWFISPGNYTSSPASVPPGTSYTLNYNPPAGYDVTVSPGSITPSSGGTGTFVATCTAKPVTVNSVSASPTALSCPSTSTITWSSTNAISCTSNWDGASVGTSGSKSVTVNSTSNYSVTCTGLGGTTDTKSTTVTVSSPSCGSPAPVVSVSASPTTINAGQSSTISWSSSNASSCSAWWTGSTATAGSQVVNPSVTTTYTMTCTGAGGSGSNSKTVTVNAAPTVTVNATPSTTSSPGQSSTISWSSTNATSCTTNWDGATVGTSGSKTVNPSSTTTYLVTCTGAGGTGQNSATVSVGTPAPTVSFSANPLTINSGDSTTLTWSSTNATSCTASNGWNDAIGISGSLAKTPGVTTTYSISCSGAGGTSPTQSVTVTVSALPTTATINVTSNVSTNWTVSGTGASGLESFSGSGTAGGPYTFHPASGGTSYSITGYDISNYTSSVSPSGSMTLSTGGSGTFAITLTPVPFSYSLQSTESPTTVLQGSPAEAKANAVWSAGTPQNVSLNVSWPNGQPSGVSYSVSPGSGCAPANGTDCPFTITINTSATTPAGTYPFTVSGSRAASNGTLSYSLTVQAGPVGGGGPTTVVPNPGKPGINEVFTSCTVNGGQTPYDYLLVSTENPKAFSDRDSGPTNLTSYTFTIPFSVTGIHPYQWTVTDANNTSVTCDPGSVKILLNANYLEF